MPEMLFHVRWLGGIAETYYSPSSIIGKHLSSGSTYTVMDFVAACGRGLRAASERVREVYGYSCSQAMDQLAIIEKRAESFAKDDVVRVNGLGPRRIREQIGHG